ncbi:phosphomannomutase (plasmid) [Rhizobium sp. WL3]|uniref:phosphomannomutase n=1 Tax=Rhizobium sp. WL3 TaxID=2603277 RepID=UPI0011C20901|nr:phosphomannomutase [Rhizobium sp. WL3]QEE43355.1 phosphomannomutase [Rhizobium sp. WL3]
MKFGTSGLRGLVTDLLGAPSARYATAFGRYLLQTGQAQSGSKVFVAGDLRPSTPQIMATCMGALERVGLTPVDCGFIPTPALALHAMKHRAACLMITGSHIPADRNGIKFYTPRGEIMKSDEQAITALADAIVLQEIDVSLGKQVEVEPAAEASFLERNRNLLPEHALKRLRIGVYQHSTVARDSLVTVLKSYGAEVIPLGRSKDFIPVDTEAVPEALVKLLRHWADMHRLDAIVSADGDGDRPLVADETGEPVRGDALGVLVARFLGAKVVSTPVTSSSGVEASGPFSVRRTKVGSPFVIEAMFEACEKGEAGVMGFEANGGVLIASSFEVAGRLLEPLPTRDSFVPILAALSAVARQGRGLSMVVKSLRLPVSLSDRLENFPNHRSARLMAYLRADRDNLNRFLEPVGKVSRVSDVDGLWIALEKGATIHFRPSGNAPEMRCYVEASSLEEAMPLLAKGLNLVSRF